MKDLQRFGAHDYALTDGLLRAEWIRDLGDAELWEASARRSLARRRAARRAVRPPWRSTAALAAGVAVTATAVVPAPSLAHRASSIAASASGSSSSTGLTATQQALGVAADGVMGPATRAAIVAFQREHGLTADGIVGPQTRAALKRAGSGESADGTARTTSSLQRGDWVAEVQSKLGVGADGVYGPQTERAVRAFQASKGLEVDGVVGSATRAALGLSGQAAAPAAAETTPVAASSGSAVSAAQAQVGKPYAYGGNGPGAFDCSGLTVHAFKAAGVALPRTSFAQYGVGGEVGRSAIQAGDLVFFDSNGPGASHVGVATGPSSFVSATSRGVMEASFASGYWSEHYVGARRVS